MMLAHANAMDSVELDDMLAETAVLKIKLECLVHTHLVRLD